MSIFSSFFFELNIYGYLLNLLALLLLVLVRTTVKLSIYPIDTDVKRDINQSISRWKGDNRRPEEWSKSFSLWGAELYVWNGCFFWI